MSTALTVTSQLPLVNSSSAPAAPASGTIVFSQNGGIFAIDSAGTIAPLLSPGEQSFPTPGALAETCHRYTISSSASPSSGVLTIGSVFLEAGMSVGHIGFGTGTTATTLATHWWVALLDSSYKQQAHSADQGAVQLAASTWYNLAMSSAYTATYTGQYFLGLVIVVSGGSVASILTPTFTPVAQLVTGANAPTPLLGGASSTGLTTPGTDGTTTYIAPTAATSNYYLYASA